MEPGTPRPSEPRTLAGNMCAVHPHHVPVPLRTVRHHIIPQEYGGPTEGGNLVAVCDTGHYNIHTGIDAVLDRHPMPNHSQHERVMVEVGVEGIKKNCREYLLVSEAEANLPDWKTANDRRVARQYAAAFPTGEID